MRAGNPSATQPRDDKGQYASGGRPSRRDRKWRTEPGFEGDDTASDDEPDTPSEAKAKPTRPASPPASEGQSWRDKRRAKAEAAGKKAERTRATRRRRLERDVEKHGRVGAAKKRVVKAGRPADKAAHRMTKKLVTAGAKKLAKTIDDDKPMGTL